MRHATALTLELIRDPHASPPQYNPVGSIHQFTLRRSIPPQPQDAMLDALHLPTMTSPAITTAEDLPAESVRSAPFETQQEDTSEFGEENSETNDVGDDQPPKPQPQKRRRVTRACDECRRKKIKCDGKQPCTHCTVYSYGMLVATCIAGNNPVVV